MKTIMMAAAMLCAIESIAQKQEVKQDTTAAAKPDTAKPGAAVKAYDKVITSKAVTRKGLFTVHRIDDSYYLEIPDSLLGREILMVSRIAKSPIVGLSAGPGPEAYYAGDQFNERVIAFEKGPSNKVFMRGISYEVRASDSTENGMYRSVRNSGLQPVLAAFPVKTYNEKEPASVIDITDIISGDNGIFGLSASYKMVFKVGGLLSDRSYIQSVKTFPQNIEIKTVKTYSSAADAAGALPFELNNSLVLLPKVPMKPRYADSRVGYFGTEYVDFDANSQGVKKTAMITRWRLEPRPQDMERYKRGELVEPQKPIVIYIDPTTPKKWVPYLIQGVNDWQVAFEKAGFKNAIIGKEAPSGDSTWSLEDALHSAIVYKPSETPNAMGPHVHDPRSGEILETHIKWYHNVMSILHNWYMIQAGAIDAKARKMEFDDELMGQLIRFVSSHEVGHTLGLRHNFGASSTVPVDSLRSKKWVEAHGHTPSIMDYARFNYVAQPEDNISRAGIFPRIGDYDKWAIEWGYTLFPDIKDGKEEKAFLNKWIIDSLSANHRLWFGREMSPDPRCQNEDLGDDAVKAGTYGIKNLKRIIERLPEWTRTPNEGYDNLKNMYKVLLNQLAMYIWHVTANIGGRYRNDRTVEEKGDLNLPVPVVRQKQAVAFLNEQVFQTPLWLLNKDITAKLSAATSDVTSLGISALENLLKRTSGLQDNIRLFGAANNYPVYEFFNDVKKGIWHELVTGVKIEAWRRDLQTAYINCFVEMITVPAGKPVEALQGERIALARLHLAGLQREIKAAIVPERDLLSKAHLQFCTERIEDVLHPKK